MQFESDTRRAFQLAALRVSDLRPEPGGWVYAVTLADGTTAMQGPFTATAGRKARDRALVQFAGEAMGGLRAIARDLLGKPKQAALSYLLRQSNPMYRKQSWQWSEEAKAAMVKRRLARNENNRRKRELEARAREAAATAEARRNVETCRIAARVAERRIAARLPSLPPATVARLAAWVASPII